MVFLKEYLPKHLREHKFIYPPAEVLESLEWLKDPGDFTRHYNRAWDEIKGNKLSCATLLSTLYKKH